MNQPLHVVIGAGATGTATANLLKDRGNAVRVITRSGSGPHGAGIELVAADAANAETLIGLTVGAAAIYNCANPQYHRWTTDWPPLAASILLAAERNDAVVVTLSNLYGYDPSNGPMSESDPFNPLSVKGSVRAKMWHDALEAHEAGRVRVTEARASDFIGPGTGANGHMGDRVVPRVLAGKSVSVVGRTDQPHSWTAISDVAETLVTIGAHEQAWGRPWNVPTVDPLTQEQLVHRMCAVAEVEPIKVKAMPGAILSIGGLFVPAIREMKEITYQFEEPFVLDSTAATDTFGLKSTPLDDTLRAAIESYR